MFIELIPESPYSNRTLHSGLDTPDCLHNRGSITVAIGNQADMVGRTTAGKHAGSFPSVQDLARRKAGAGMVYVHHIRVHRVEIDP
jgi:hypothetical protein